MNFHIKRALEAAEIIKKSSAIDPDVWDDLISNIENADEDITDLEDEKHGLHVRVREAESYAADLEEEAERYTIFPTDSLEDQGKVEILFRMYQKYSWNELTEIENQQINKTCTVQKQ